MIVATLTALALGFVAGSASADEYVNGYYTKGGTYVQPHHRSSPDGNPYNNYSYPGNTNPYTGKVAPGNSNTYLNNYNNGGTFGGANQRRGYGLGDD